MAATMTFKVEFIWSGKKPNILRRKLYESEYATVNNWLKKRTNSEEVTIPRLEELINAYCVVYPDLKMVYKISATGELIGETPEGEATVVYQLGKTL
jgi:hypothetical protein